MTTTPQEPNGDPDVQPSGDPSQSPVDPVAPGEPDADPDETEHPD